MRLFDVRLDLDAGCNYKCIYCQNRSQSSSGATYFSIDKLSQLLQILEKYCWSVYLSCGGEPTLHPKFNEIMRTLIPRLLHRADVFLVTNGFLLDQEKCKAIVESEITRVSVSVDTVSSKIYGFLCGCAAGALETVLGNIEMLLRIRGNQKYPKIFLTSVAMKSTIENMPDVCRYVVEAKLDGHRIQPMIPYDTIGMQEEDIYNLGGGGYSQRLRSAGLFLKMAGFTAMFHSRF